MFEIYNFISSFFIILVLILELILVFIPNKESVWEQDSQEKRIPRCETGAAAAFFHKADMILFKS